MNLKMMPFRKYSARSLIFITAILVLAGCASVTERLATTPAKEKVVEHNLISGREGSNGPVLAVKIDDTAQAHPQIGIDQADVVYIEQVEGGLTRLAAVFSSIIPIRIGPVRSARISDIDLLAQYGHVAFAYSGAQQKLLPVIAAANLENLGAQRESPLIYTRDPARIAPVDMVLRADLLMAKLIEQNVSITPARSPGWYFGSAPIGGKSIISATMKWPASFYSATWSAGQSRWLMSHAGNPDFAESGKQLGPTTLVIQMVSITPSEYHDKFGGVTPFSATVGQGTGYILRDGKVFKAQWQRLDAASGTRWTLADGTSVAFAPGQIWVALTDSAPEFTLPIASAGPTIASATPTPTK
ncbi:MAG: DUF3048 domain-containing protein [Actinomycetota bacterium]